MPRVSVIIPAYNAMRYLPETIDSLLSQTFEDFEAIIIDDGSHDNIEEWFGKNQDPRLQLISQPNQGQAKARNVGMQRAKGEYIAFLDADDLWKPSKLEKQVALLNANPDAGVVYTWVSGINSEGVLRGRTIKNCAEGNVWRELILHNILECGSTPLIRRSCFEQVGDFDVELPPCEDLDLWLRIACHYDFLVVKEPLVYYRQHDGSSGKNWQRAENKYLVLLEKSFNNPLKDVSPAELNLLKPKAYAMPYLRFLSWSALQGKEKDYKAARELCQKARAYYPKVIFDKDYIRIMVATSLIQYLKPKNYDRFLGFLYFVRRNIFGFSPTSE
jgi:glycosyltransferase involved in cell wall biosynthesis